MSERSSFLGSPVITAAAIAAAGGVTSTSAFSEANRVLLSGGADRTAKESKIFSTDDGITTVAFRSISGFGLQLETTDGNLPISLAPHGTGQVQFGKNAVPATSDGAALGTTTLMWSDLFLASGGVVNFNNGDVTLTHGTDILTMAGGRFVNSFNAAASSPPVSLTGSWFTGGSGTTTKPQFLVEASGATSTGWNTSGTGVGINAPSGFTGRLIDAQVNGTSMFRVLSSGDFETTGGVNSQGAVNCRYVTSLPAGGGPAPITLYTAGIGIYAGSGAPTVSAAKGSIYLRSDGSGVNDRAYINTNGSTTWTAFVTVA